MLIDPSTRKRLEVEVENCKEIAREERLAAASPGVDDVRSQAHERVAEYYAGMAGGISWTIWAIDTEEVVK